MMESVRTYLLHDRDVLEIQIVRDIVCLTGLGCEVPVFSTQVRDPREKTKHVFLIGIFLSAVMYDENKENNARGRHV